MKKIITFLVLILLAFANVAYTTNPNPNPNPNPSPITLYSPDKLIIVTIKTGSILSYSVAYKNNMFILESPLGFEFEWNSQPLEKDFNEISHEYKTINETWKPLYGKHETVVNNCNEIRISLQERRFPARKLVLYFRAYNDGIAFRYYFPEQISLNSFTVNNEKSTFHFADDYTCWAADYGSFHSAQESEFRKINLSDITNDNFIGLPLLVRVNDSLFAAITESDLFDWAGMYIGPSKEKLSQGVTLKTRLSTLSQKPGLKEAAVKFKTPHFTPWRIVMIAKHPGRFIESELIENLSEPNKLEGDLSWIKPGKCAWDNWWSGDTKMNTETIKKYIQFASDMGFPYQLIDWQWYGEFNKPEADITKINPDVDMPEVLRFAKEKNVKCWVWLYNTDVDRKIDEAFALYEKWGLAGVKIDFMDNDNQETVNWYEKTVKKAAQYHLMVNFHGAFKPSGQHRTYPNLITREGLLGNEYNGWSTRVTPEHNVSLAYTRLIAGPMDYTPGGFRNRSMSNFKVTRPTEVMGTRCHELSKFVVYYSPLTTVCDNPDNYYNQQGLDFLKIVPTTCDDIKVLNGEVGEYITIAKRKGNKWFLGGMNNSEGREIEVSFNFLGNGSYKLHLYSDAPDSDINAEKLTEQDMKVTSKDKIKIKMANGGGFVGVIE